MLFTNEYQKQQQQLHEDRPDYGVASVSYAPLVTDVVNKMQITHLLDYGCGKCRLFQNLKADHKMTLQAYDPGMPDYADSPVSAEMVTCIDVLEHIEPECLDDVLDDLERLTEVVGLFTVHCGPAAKVLSDGRNAHLIQKPPEWWLPKIMERWELQSFNRAEGGFWVIVQSIKPLIDAPNIVVEGSQ